ncbi:hypothetical protein [Evansella cellulosilytica]|uniref:Cellobiose phosphorylase n=1 Tax=Evansella cellulosilytica (strain ATCC 21833 / DSM 2522 / FERM P-1141 / JCM 9156 / N-4) TaxID=649639 RepID=E6TZA2_EVAC2|nr:hypothetical protein [Evansella cellulosilytica]ADU28964.1 hypothetical protein Bcell_0682 [Evansella cellulosilytica DSM 2522]
MYKLIDNQKFEISEYRKMKTFSSFLPGISGVNGIPMWVFYVNRGQGIASFGVQDKDHAIMEFLPADKSYQRVALDGFRTFIKIIDGSNTTFIEPFTNKNNSDNVSEKMIISENMVELEYVHEELGLQIKVEYFTLPEAEVAGLVRHVTITNLLNDKRSFEILDGLPAIFPSGVPNIAYKELGNTIKSWFDVVNIENNIPFYRLRGSMEDSSEVKEIHHGNFYASFSKQGEKEALLIPIVDRDNVFGTDTSLQTPEKFISDSLENLHDLPQQVTNKVSSGFSGDSFDLENNETFEIVTVIGHAHDIETMRRYTSESLNVAELMEKKEIAKAITDSITSKINTKSGHPTFDAYSRQSFLDNGLRGGFPINFENENGNKIYYLFSRKHGDLERDYNFFSLSPTFYSQGNGNYRDVNQNRRCDVLFEPKVGDYNVKLFMNLIQLDGYNPLAVKGVKFVLPKDGFSQLENYVDHGQDKLQKFFEKPYTPGELMHFVEGNNVSINSSFEEFLTEALVLSEDSFQADFGEGYWMDHWTYNLDLIESYLSVFPDKLKDFYFDQKYRFFDSPVRVKTRKEKYVFNNDGKLRQYHAVEKIKEKAEKAAQNDGVLWVNTEFGSGKVYETNLFSKLFLLALVKTTTMAPYGLGIEMEGDKPGWNDSLNGLPGMFGSSTSELFELKRLVEMLLEVESGEEVSLPKEVDNYLKNVISEIKALDASKESELKYWSNTTQHREEYRDLIYKGISGEEVHYSFDEIKEYLTVLKDRVEQGVAKVESTEGELIPTYYYFEPKNVTDKLDVSSLEWEAKPVTPFLEGIVKQLKVTNNEETAKKLYDKVKDSNIYDKKLKMYKTSMSIANDPNELGRAKSFTPGWLENESIFLHMEYKYLLATLKSGLKNEFFEDIQSALIPFLDPEVYGRSTLENSSFIASSANPNQDLHGRGFVSRLSGSTIEFMNMWFVMMAGSKPFDVKNGELVCELSPSLPSWMFNEDGELTFTFLGHTEVTYVNRSKSATFGHNAVSPKKLELVFKDGTTKILLANELVGATAEAVRSGEVSKMVVELA